MLSGINRKYEGTFCITVRSITPMHHGIEGLAVIDNDRPVTLHVDPISVQVSVAAQLIGISERFAWDLVKTRELPSFKIGKKVRLVRYVDAVAYIDRLAEEAQAELAHAA